MGDYRIPFNRPALAGRELEYIRDAIEAGHISGDGPYTARCRRFLEALLGSPRVLLTTSCTHALEMAALLLDIRPGDDVIVPSFTFVSTVNAFVLRGARPVFVDIRPDTLNIDPDSVAHHLTARTRAIVPVHYAGIGCDMDALLGLAARVGAAIVEDNAHGLFGRWNGRWLGTFGPMAALSFHETKNLTCGEGGALVLNDPRLIERAEIVREKGTDRSRFFRGEVDKYGWVSLGSSYLPSDLLAAFLWAQLQEWPSIQAARRRIWERYLGGLSGWAADSGVGVPVVPPEAEPAHHMFYLLLPTRDAREALIAHLKARGVLAVFHYLPLHLSAVGRGFGGRPGDCPTTESVSERLVRLPFYRGLAEAEQEEVIQEVRAFRP